MTAMHPQETILKVFDYRGAPVALAAWRETVWCGKIGYAANQADEPDVEAVMKEILALDISRARMREPDWEACISVNYLSGERPNGVMFAALVHTAEQPAGFDVYRVPAAQYLRVELSEKTARALGREMWQGGIPPYEWIGEQIAPALGYRYASDTLPIFEYYGCWLPAENRHVYSHLYVPVEPAGGKACLDI